MELLQECDRYYGQWAFVGRCGPRGNWVRSLGHVQFLGCLLCTIAGANAGCPLRLRRWTNPFTVRASYHGLGFVQGSRDRSSDTIQSDSFPVV